MLLLRFVSIHCLLLMVSGGIVQDESDESTEIPQKGIVHLQKAYVNVPSTECATADPSKVVFNLYTREHPFEPEILRIDDDDDQSIRHSAYNVKKPSKFLIHGYLQTANETRAMVLDYLYTNDSNIIAVDWSEYAQKCDLNTTQNVVLPTVAPAIAKLMKKLIAYGSTAEEHFHVVAYGVGAHIAAQAAKKLFPVQINRISALDPVGYMFEEPGRRKLQSSDAHFVDVFYSSRPHLGSVRNVGHVNFYPNGGKHPQPGCTDEQHLCSSLSSYKLWTKSILTPLKAYKCDNYVQYQQRRCPGTKYIMGEHVSHHVRGKFYVDIDATHPSYD